LVEFVTVGRSPVDIVTARIQAAAEVSEPESDPLDRNLVITKAETPTSLAVEASHPIPDPSLQHPLLAEPDLVDQGHVIQKARAPKPGSVSRMENRLRSSPGNQTQFFDACGNLKDDAAQLKVIPPPFRKKPGALNNCEGQTTFIPATVWGI
jgi:hypothetical protein